MHWYIIKRNWRPIVCALKSTFASTKIDAYLGLGGETWPLDIERDPEASELHSRLLKSRDYIPLEDGSEEAVCTDLAIAKEYLRLCAKRYDDVVLLEVSPVETGGKGADGLDFGHAGGGYSVIETEIFAKGNVDAAGALNAHGLFADHAALVDFVESLKQRNDVEDLEMYGAFFLRCVERIQREGPKKT